MKKTLLLCVASVLAVYSAGCAESSNSCDITNDMCQQLGLTLDSDKCECVLPQQSCDLQVKTVECVALGQTVDVNTCSCKSVCDPGQMSLCVASGGTFDSASCTCNNPQQPGCDTAAKIIECAGKGMDFDASNCGCKAKAAQCDTAAKIIECAGYGMDFDASNCGCKAKPAQCDTAAKIIECAGYGMDFDASNCICKAKPAPGCDTAAKTAECTAANKDFDEATCDCKAKPAPGCDTAAKTAECTAANKDFDAATCTCKDKPAPGCDTAAKTAECTAAGKDFDAATCTCKDKPAPGCDTAAKTAECAAAGKDFDAATCSCKDKSPTEFKVNEVPATQNSTIGAACNPDTFVEHCNGNNVLFCDYADEDATSPTVVNWDCAEGNEPYTCAITLDDRGMNYAECVSKTTEDVCSDEDLGAVDKVCSHDYDAYEIEEEFLCAQFNDGKNHWFWIGDSYCSDICSPEKGCTQTRCSGESYVCDANNTYVKECSEFEDGNYYYTIWNCAVDQLVCVEDPEYGDYCDLPDTPITDECDPSTYAGSCSQDGKTRYYCDNNGKIISKPCSGDTQCVVKGPNSTACEGGSTQTCTLTNADCEAQNKILDNQNCVCVGDCVEGGTSYCKRNCSTDKSKGYYYTNGQVKVVTCPDNDCIIDSNNHVVCENGESGGDTPVCALTNADCEAQNKILDNQNCVCVGDCVEGGTSYCKRNCSSDKSKGYYYSSGQVQVVTCPNKDCIIDSNNHVVCENGESGGDTPVCALTDAVCEAEGKILDNQKCECVGDCVKGGTSYCKKNCSADKSEGYYYSGGEVKVQSCPNKDCHISSDNKVECGQVNTNPNPGNDDRTAGAPCNPDTYYGACSDDLTKRYYCHNTEKIVKEADCTINNYTQCDLSKLNGGNSSRCK